SAVRGRTAPHRCRTRQVARRAARGHRALRRRRLHPSARAAAARALPRLDRDGAWRRRRRAYMDPFLSVTCGGGRVHLGRFTVEVSTWETLLAGGRMPKLWTGPLPGRFQCHRDAARPTLMAG